MRRSTTWRSIVFLVLALLLIPLAGTEARSPRLPAPPRHSPSPSPRGVPPLQGPALEKGARSDWWAAVREEILQSEYDVTWQAPSSLPGVSAPASLHTTGAYQAPNRAQNLRSYFAADGPVVVPRSTAEGQAMPAWHLTWNVVGWGREGAVEPAERTDPSPTGRRIAYRRGKLTEWYVNDERGLEQELVLASRPAGKRHMVVELELGGSVTPRLEPDGTAVQLVAPGGEAGVRYGRLEAADAAGRRLAAEMRLASPHTLQLVLDDGAATYPITIGALLTGLSPTADWTAESDQSDDHFLIVSTAGDVNGDGYSDVIVGAYLYDHGETDEGRAFVYHGSARGLSTAADWTAESNQASALFGSAVGTAGDVNGDGYADVIIGACGYDHGEINEGGAFVYYGGPSGLTTGAADWTAESDQEEAQMGHDHSLGTAGDVNGDGYSDVVIGAPYYDSGENEEGRAFVYHGGPSGLTSGAANWTAEGDQEGAFFGMAIGTAGDVNGDGYADVIVGAYDYGNGQVGEGKAYVYHGSSTGLTTGAADWSAEGDLAYAKFGISVSTAGDVNGDGYADVIIGASSYDDGEYEEGWAFVYHGSGTGLEPGPADWTAESDQSGALLGFAVSTAGDVNGDGYGDVVVGAWMYDGGETDEGRVYVYHGGPSGLTGGAADWTAEGNGANVGLGYSVGTAGDVNGDGYSDVIASAPLYDDVNYTYAGRVYVYHGAAGGLTENAAWSAEGNQALSGFGFSTGTAGDVNGDGYADVIVGAYNYDGGGRAFVYHGAAGGPSTTANWSADGGAGSGHFGYSVGTAGDVNGDGYADVIIGGPLSDQGQNNEGQASVYHGSPTGLSTGPADWTAEGDQMNANLGHSVGTAGDVNGDGFADVIVGAHQYDGGAGRALVYHGSPGGLSGVADWAADSDQAGAYLGVSVGSAGDVNGDGYADAIVGAYGYDQGEENEGAAFVYLGSAEGLTSGPADWMAASDQTNAELGCSVGTAGDVNGDGYADVIVGARSYENGQHDEGRAVVYHGGPMGLTTGAADWYTESDRDNAQLGWSVATAGDVNGDGFADVIVGAPLYDGSQFNQGRAVVHYGSAAGLGAGVADWMAEIDQDSARFGWSVGSAGDVNGDGFADVLVGTETYDGDQVDEGGAFVYLGNGGAGLSLTPRQMRSDGSAPIAPLGRSDSTTAVRLGLVGRTPLGRGEVKLQWQVAPLGAPFTATTAISGTEAAWTDVGTSGAVLGQVVGGLTPDTAYHWRARLLYEPGNRLGQRAGRWVHVPWNGWKETDFRTPSLERMLTGFGPAANDHTVALTSTVWATYDHPMDPTRVHTGTFAVQAMQTGLLTQTYGVTGGTIELVPSAAFKPGELVQVSATTGTLSLSGQGPISPTVWQFWAEAAGGSGFLAESGQDLGSSYSADVALGDLDGDGDLDAFVANANGQGNKVWLGDGTGAFGDSGQNLGSSGSNGVALGDLDGDGDLDAFVANSFEPPNRVWLNDGMGSFFDSGQSLGNSHSYDVALGDVDGDGDLDAFVANPGFETNRVWLNDGRGGFGDSGQGLGSADSLAMALGDLDSDGDLDAFVANGGGIGEGNRVWMNDGTGRYSDSGQDLGGAVTRDVALGDVDGDGDLDAFVVNLGADSRVWVNSGTGVFTDSGQGLVGASSWSLGLGDVDGDGDLDAVVGRTNGEGNQVWLNDGAGNFDDSGQRLGNSDSLALALGDLDADGDLDAFVGNAAQADQAWLNLNPPDGPDLLPIYNVDGDGDYLVDWDEVTDAITYTLEEDDSSQFPSPVVRYAGASSQYAVSGQGEGTWYYRVKATHAGGAGPWSNVVSATVHPTAPADAYEEDDTCGQARAIGSDGSVQSHNFHDAGDDDWVRFDAQAERSYLIQVDNVGARVDAVVMLFDTCDVAPLAVEDNAFGPTVQMAWDAPASGTYYLRILQNDPATFGPETDYELSVSVDAVPPAAPRSVRSEAANEALIVQWRRSPEPDVAGYRIRWGPFSGGPYTAYDEVDGADNTYYEITGLTNGTACYLVLTALDISGNESAFSVEIGNIPSPSADSTVPEVSITRPTANPTYTTTVPYLSLGGTATDAGNNLSRVRVRNTANGAEGWDYGLAGSDAAFDVDALPLAPGENPIQVTVYDAADNLSSTSLTVRRLAGQHGAVVLAGGHNDSHSLQSNIDYLTNRAYRTFLDAGFGPEEIFYLSPSPQDADGDGLSDVISATTPVHLHAALQWAATRVGPGIPFFLYLADHGEKEFFCADGCYGAGRLWTDQLDAWLDELETTSGCDLVHVVIEACHSGSFIDVVDDAAQSLSQDGRVLITATDRDHNAYASAQGAFFSDAFFSAVAEGQSLLASFEQAKAAVELNTHSQSPWLDDNGDGLYSPDDGSHAADRYVSSFFGAIPPRITAASATLQDGSGTLRATVERGGEPLDTVWAAIYGPSFQEPVDTALNPGVPLVELQPDPVQEGLFTALYEAFDEPGIYRVVVYAQDRAGHHAQPVLIEAGSLRIYLPLVVRQ
jgi:hypothetical protein